MATPKKKQPKPAPQETNGRIVINDGSPLVFVSHDTRDADLAEEFANLLTDASGGALQSFRSSDRKGTSGIEFGAEWYASIMSNLSSATDVVALLTPHSLDRPWILYETGVAKGKLDATVLGLALNIPLEKVATGPFAQFQNCADDEDSLTKLVLQLIRRTPNVSPREKAVRLQVQAFRESIKPMFDKHSKTPATQAKVDDNAIAKMFEEVKVLVRDLPDRVGNRVYDPSRRRFSSKRFHSGMLEETLELCLDSGRAEDFAVGLIMVFSLFRDEAPWFYELGMELTRAIRGGKSGEVESAYRGLCHSVEMLFDKVVGFELLGNCDKDVIFMMRRLSDRLEYFLRRSRSTKKKEPESSEPRPV